MDYDGDQINEGQVVIQILCLDALPGMICRPHITARTCTTARDINAVGPHVPAIGMENAARLVLAGDCLAYPQLF